MTDVHGDGEKPGRENQLSTADLAGASESKPAETRSFAEAGEREDAGPLFSDQEAKPFRDRWTSIQAGFVDEPRKAVEQADGLVADVMKQLAEMFANERSELERQWEGGENVSTEDLRQALRRYRSFFTRLLSV